MGCQAAISTSVWLISLWSLAAVVERGNQIGLLKAGLQRVQPNIALNLALRSHGRCAICDSVLSVMGSFMATSRRRWIFCPLDQLWVWPILSARKMFGSIAVLGGQTCALNAAMTSCIKPTVQAETWYGK